MKIYFQLEQGTPEWLDLRRGKPTASNMGTIIGKGDTRTKYLYKLAAERVSGIVEETYKNAHMERGNEREPIIRQAYIDKKRKELDDPDFDVTTVAFVDCGTWGASPDGIIGDNGGLEIKSRIGSVQIEHWESGKIPTTNLPQINACMLALDREWWDYVSDSEGLPLFIKRHHRTKESDTLILDALDRFNTELSELVERIKKHA